MTTGFYSTIENRRRRGTYDAELELRDYAATAISATTSETGVQFDVRAQELFKVCFSAAAYTGYTATTAEWRVKLEISDVVGGTYTQVGEEVALNGTVQEFEIPLSGGYCEFKDADAKYIRVTATKVGAPGNLTFGAWIVP